MTKADKVIPTKEVIDLKIVKVFSEEAQNCKQRRKKADRKPKHFIQFVVDQVEDLRKKSSPMFGR